uniref:F5/8 type C domain-containing protein n=1 Tax=Amphiprion ocellaris TaxID=80972 RepID=A0AAQ5X6G0_AMPOC
MERTGAITATLVLLLPLICCSGGETQKSAVREYYIAAVEIGWDYIYLDETDPASDQRWRSKGIPQKYVKAVYREYTDSTYSVPRPRPAWTGIQGPMIVAQAGDRVVVHFKNLASQPYSISPVGITYWKQSEGAGYDDSTAGREKEDDAISPGGYYEYVWDINYKDSPTPSDPDCLTYSYSSQVDTVRDVNSGLIGALLICKPSQCRTKNRKYPAYVLLFAVFDETKSWYGEVGERQSREKFKRTDGRKEYHTINGYVNSTLPGLTVCQGRSPVFWHMIGVGTSPEIHSIQFQDHSLQVLSHRKVTVEVTPMTFITAEMRATSVGRFPISCQINSHHHDGMNAVFNVEKCPEPVTPPVPDLRNVKHNYDDYYDDLFNFQTKKPQVQVRASRGQQSKTWVHYIAAEEVTWDYAPHLEPTDSNLQSRYLPAVPHHLDYKYKKVVYVEYTDGSFTQRKNPDNTLLGPILKGKVNDQLHIIFRNLASRPFNIFPNGLTKIIPLQKTTNGKQAIDDKLLLSDLRSMGVPPNGTFGYIWSLTTDDGPLEEDPPCLTQLYQSTVSLEKDLASGLVGTLLICKSDTIDIRGNLLGADKKFSLVFAVFDENRSWYFDENMQQSNQKSFNITDPEFYNSNVIYSTLHLYFYVFLMLRRFVMCQTDVPFWHVANVGAQSDFLSVYFTGNLFQYQGSYQSVVTLFPMTAVTVPMETELIGKRSQRNIYNNFLREEDVRCFNESNEILLDSEPLLSEEVSIVELSNLEDMDQNLVPQNNVKIEHEKLTDDPMALKPNFTATNTNTTRMDLSLEYDDYNQEVLSSDILSTYNSKCHKLKYSPLTTLNAKFYLQMNSTSEIFGTDSIDPRSGGGPHGHFYYIAAEEITWDYGIRKPHQEMRRGMRKFLPEYKKVVFRAYEDAHFLKPVNRGELEEHLGIMGPFIRTEIDDVLTVIFKNKAQRPYSFHLHGVYDRSQGAEPVPPGEARTYNWKVTRKQGPTDPKFDCKTGAYYSTVDKERDLHSGLIGPLVICKSGKLKTNQNAQQDLREFSLLFHTFDETKSWYLEENLQRYCAPPCQVNTEDPWYHTSNMFAAINGYVAETLPGLRVAQRQLVRWHLLNVGSDREYHAVHFHGLPFTVHAQQEHRMGVYSLFPGVFGTVEMSPPTVGTWLVECSIGDHQLAGMRAKLMVYNPGRYSWEPRLARLDQSGYINAWMGRNNKSWIQVDLQRPTLLHGLLTQGVRSKLRDHYITFFTVSYSLDQESWTTYVGNNTRQTSRFHGNTDSSRVKENRFFPPLVARYIRIHPYRFVQRPALRLELLGCDLNSCSFPLGLQRQINDTRFKASSHYSSLLQSWKPSLARLHLKGRANAWRPKNNNPHEWLQVDLEKVRRITGVITQGARSLLTQMMVTEFSVTVSPDGQSWSSVLEENSQREKIFNGNNDPDEEALSVFDPPLFGRFLRIHPRGWINDIALRLEVLGCDTQQGI